jgi:DNA-binding MarR family transcriptional regulator
VTGEPDIWLSDREQVLWRRLLTVEFRLRERLDHELRSGHGISLGDYAVLVNLSEAPGHSLRMSDLAERILLSRSGLTRRVDALVKRGLVTRQSCPADGRGSMAELTSAGAELLGEAASTHVAGVREYLIDALGSLDGLSPGLARIETALD